MVMGQTIATTEVLVVGAGPGGYVAAIRAAQLGFDVMLVDKAGELGGMCLHHGCIPSKALIHAMNLYHEVKNAEKIGIIGENVGLNFEKTQEWKGEVIQKLHSGIDSLCKKHNIQIVKATAKFQNNTQAVLEGEGLDFNAVEFRKCIIATGSRPRELPIAPFGGNILSSREVLELQQPPPRFAVIGGGYIGVELGVMMAKAGSEVTILEATDKVLAAVEQEQADVAVKRLQELGVNLKTNFKIDNIEQHDWGVKIIGPEHIDAEKVLVAIGHVPVADGLQLELAGVEVNERGFVKVNDQCKTNVDNIYAVGDITGGVMLAHKASAQGKVAAEAIAEKPVAFEPQAIPAVIFSDPEIASVGLRQKEALEKYGDVKVGKFPFAALGKAIAITQTEGFVKIISDKDGVILGVHGAGPGVTDYISEAALAIEMGATAEDLALTIHPHPTLSESLSEASEALLGEAIHIYQPKK